MAEHEDEAKSKEQDPAEAGIHDTFHQNIHGLARTTETDFQHSKADLHAEDEERRHQGPNCVDRIDNVVALKRRIGSERSPTNLVRVKQHSPKKQQAHPGKLTDEQERS